MTEMEKKATICLNVVWPEEFGPKWETDLHKALQTWLNKNTIETNCLGLTVQDDGRVKVDISGSSAQEDLFTQETKLTLKNLKTALVTRVMPGDRMPETQAADVHKPEDFSSMAPPVTVSCTLPLVDYWYVNQVCREKMKAIENENRVQIEPDMKVSFNVHPSTAGDPDKALDEFIKLVQSCLDDSNCVTYTNDELGQVDWGKAVRIIQQGEEKLTLTVSSHGVEVCGPMKSLTDFESVTKIQRKIPNTQSSAREAQTKSNKVKMNFRDPLVNSGLQMDATHFRLMTIAHKDEIDKIESRFGVQFHHSDDRVRAIAKSGAPGHDDTLESHALRALLCLYQRVATSVMSCSPLSQPSQAKIQKEMLSGHPGVVLDQQGDQWRIIGLPENLCQAVEHIEQKIGTAVFKDEDKQRIGCLKAQPSSESFFSLSRFNPFS